MAMPENKPTAQVNVEHATIDIRDAHSAELAMDALEPVLEFYLAGGDDDRTTEDTEVRRRAHDGKVPVECEHCGYEWRYGGKATTRTMCPDCNTGMVLDPPVEPK